MSRPTEPGWYWLKDQTGWQIVQVGARHDVTGQFVDEVGQEAYQVYHFDSEWTSPTYMYGSDQWGGKITQEPVTDPPPPF